MNFEKKKLVPFKQNLHDSCLVAAFLMISGISSDDENAEKAEKEIFLTGEKKTHDFWIQSMLNSMLKFTDKKICLVVDNKFFANTLSRGLQNNDRIEISQEKISTSLITKLTEKYFLAINLDNQNLGDWAHAPHWVVVEKASRGKITFIDPNTAGRRIFSEEKLDLVIASLNNHLRICPLLIYLK